MTNEERYNEIHDTLCLEYALGLVTLEVAEIANTQAYEKYILEKNQLDFYADKGNSKDDKLVASPGDVIYGGKNMISKVTKPVGKVTGKVFSDFKDDSTKLGKIGKAAATPARAFGDGLEKAGRNVGKMVTKKPITNDPNLVNRYNDRLNKWGKAIKVGGYLGTFAAIYAISPLAPALPKTAGAKATAYAASSVFSPSSHTAMEIHAARDKDIEKGFKICADKISVLRNKLKDLCNKHQGEQITPQLKGEFDKINAAGLAAIRQASIGFARESTMDDMNEDLISLFNEAGKLHDDKVDAIFYAINHADYTNSTVVESIDDYIDEYM